MSRARIKLSTIIGKTASEINRIAYNILKELNERERLLGVEDSKQYVNIDNDIDEEYELLGNCAISFRDETNRLSKTLQIEYLGEQYKYGKQKIIPCILGDFSTVDCLYVDRLEVVNAVKLGNSMHLSMDTEIGELALSQAVDTVRVRGNVFIDTIDTYDYASIKPLCIDCKSYDVTNINVGRNIILTDSYAVEHGRERPLVYIKNNSLYNSLIQIYGMGDIRGIKNVVTVSDCTVCPGIQTDNFNDSPNWRKMYEKLSSDFKTVKDRMITEENEKFGNYIGANIQYKK